MPLILRAIITGFGHKLGAELGRYVSERIGLARAPKKEKSDDDDLPEGISESENDPPAG